MLKTHDISLRFGKRTLFEDVTTRFSPGNCYGVIGANGAGKSTLLKVLSGEIEPSSGNISVSPGKRRREQGTNKKTNKLFTAPALKNPFDSPTIFWLGRGQQMKILQFTNYDSGKT